MGPIAKQILIKFRQARDSKVIQFKDHLAAQRRSEENLKTMGDVKILLDKGYDPVHAAYVTAQNLISLFAEASSMLPELNPYVKIVGKSEYEYIPDGPPFSPLTRSYFTTWAFFDVRFGRGKETIASIMLDLGSDLEIPKDLLMVIEVMRNSRMGFYEHYGIRGSKIVLCDLADGKEYLCHSATGYKGQKGQIWYARLMSQLLPFNYNVVFTTPYILQSAKIQWIEFFNRTIPKIKGPKRPRPVSEAIHDLQKFGLNPNYWNEYVFLSYMNFQNDAIFLTGIPDIPSTLPHAN